MDISCQLLKSIIRKPLNTTHQKRKVRRQLKATYTQISEQLVAQPERSIILNRIGRTEQSTPSIRARLGPELSQVNNSDQKGIHDRIGGYQHPKAQQTPFTNQFDKTATC